MTFNLTVNMDNDAFQDHAELSRIIRKLCETYVLLDAVRGKEPDPTGKLMDSNGNTVGSWEIVQ